MLHWKSWLWTTKIFRRQFLVNSTRHDRNPDLIAYVGEPHLEFHLWRLSVKGNVNAFYIARLVVFRDLADGEEQGFNAWACYDAEVQSYTNYLENNRATEYQILKGDFDRTGWTAWHFFPRRSLNWLGRVWFVCLVCVCLVCVCLVCVCLVCVCVLGA